MPDTEDEWISTPRSRWPRGEDATPEAVDLADQAVRAFPMSARLWVARGNLIELGSETCPHDLEEALRSYERAAKLDPQFAEAWEEIGHYYDAVLDDEAAARVHLRKAQRIRNQRPG